MLGAIARSLGLKDRSGKEPSDQYWYQVVRGHYFKSGGDAGVFHKLNTARVFANRRREKQIGIERLRAVDLEPLPAENDGDDE
jgi:hypothetical protein